MMQGRGCCFVYIYLLKLILSDVLWHSTMISNDYSNWTFSNANVANYLSNNGDCPTGISDTCWEICNLDNNLNDSISRTVSTQGYESITLTFNLALYLMGSGHEYCRLYFNFFGSAWTPIFSYGDQGNEKNNEIVALPQSAENNDAVGIKIWPDSGTLGCCLMSNVYLSGTVAMSLSTSTPTTNKPTTSIPTTYSPTTNIPTTYSPTTKSPTTYSPTTNIPTTNIPTTYSPTTNSPTTKSPTTSSPTTNSPTTSLPTTNIPTSRILTTSIPTTSIPTTMSTTTTYPTSSLPTTSMPTEMNSIYGSIAAEKQESSSGSNLFILLFVTIACIVLLSLIVIILVIIIKKRRTRQTDIGAIKDNIQLGTAADTVATDDNILSDSEKANIAIQANGRDAENILSQNDQQQIVNQDESDENDDEDMYTPPNKNQQIQTTKGNESDSELYEEMNTNGNTAQNDLNENDYTSTEGNNEYKMIQSLLKQCDSEEWSEYLNVFKEHRITDKRLKHIPYDDAIWETLFVEIGIRFQFKDLYKAQ